MRLAVTLTLCLALTGCTPQSPPSYVPELCAAAGVAASMDAAPPTPAPDTRECTNCGGTGKLGDGTVEVDCPVCGGDGVQSAAIPSTPAAPVAPVEARTLTPAAVQWRATLRAAQDESLQTGRPLFVLVSTEQCAACSVLKSYLRTPAIANYVNTNYVPYEALPGEFMVALYPTQIIFAGGEEVIRRQGAPRNAEDYLRIFQQDYATAMGA